MDELVFATPLRAMQAGMAKKTPQTAKSTKRKRLATIQAPELRIFHDLPEKDVACVQESVQKPVKPKAVAQEISTQTTPPPAPASASRRVSFGGRVRDALDMLAAAARPKFNLEPTLEEPAEEAAEAAAPAPAVRPCVEHAEIATSPMPSHARDATVGTSPLAAACMATMTSPAAAHSVGTMTAPPAAASALVSLMQSASPATLRRQIETLSISNEILRDHQQQLQRAADGATTKEATLRQQLDGVRMDMSRCAAAAKVQLEELCQQLADREDQLEQAMQQLREKEALPLQSPEDAALLAELQQNVAEANSRIEAAEAQLARAEQALGEAQRSAEMAQATARAEAAKAEQHAQVSRALQDDLRVSFHRHKQDLAALEQQYQHENYAARYTALIQRMEASSALTAAVAALQPQMAAQQELEEATLFALEEKAAALEAQQEEMEALRAHMAMEMASLQQTNASLQSELASNSAALAQAEATLLQRDQELATLQAAYDETSAAVEGLAVKLQQVLENTEKDEQIAALEGMQAQLQEELEHAKQNIFSREEEVANMRGEIDLLNEQQEMLKDELQKLQSKPASDRDRLALENEALRTVLQQRDECIEKLTEQIDEQARQHTELRDFIAEERLVRQEVMDESERELTGLRARVTALQEETTAAQMQLEVQRKHHEEELNALKIQSEFNESAKSLEVLHAQTSLAQLGGELVDKELQVFEAKAALAPLQKQLDDALARAAEWEQRMSQKDSDIAYLRSYLNTFQERSQEKIATLQSNLAKAEAEVQELDEALARALQGNE